MTTLVGRLIDYSTHPADVESLGDIGGSSRRWSIGRTNSNLSELSERSLGSSRKIHFDFGADHEEDEDYWKEDSDNMGFSSSGNNSRSFHNIITPSMDEESSHQARYRYDSGSNDCRSSRQTSSTSSVRSFGYGVPDERFSLDKLTSHARNSRKSLLSVSSHSPSQNRNALQQKWIQQQRRASMAHVPMDSSFSSLMTKKSNHSTGTSRPLQVASSPFSNSGRSIKTTPTYMYNRNTPLTPDTDDESEASYCSTVSISFAGCESSEGPGHSETLLGNSESYQDDDDSVDYDDDDDDEKEEEHDTGVRAQQRMPVRRSIFGDCSSTTTPTSASTPGKEELGYGGTEDLGTRAQQRMPVRRSILGGSANNSAYVASQDKAVAPAKEDLGYGSTKDLGYGDAAPDLGYGETASLGYEVAVPDDATLGYGDKVVSASVHSSAASRDAFDPSSYYATRRRNSIATGRRTSISGLARVNRGRRASMEHSAPADPPQLTPSVSFKMRQRSTSVDSSKKEQEEEAVAKRDSVLSAASTHSVESTQTNGAGSQFPRRGRRTSGSRRSNSDTSRRRLSRTRSNVSADGPRGGLSRTPSGLSWDGDNNQQGCDTNGFVGSRIIRLDSGDSHQTPRRGRRGSLGKGSSLLAGHMASNNVAEVPRKGRRGSLGLPKGSDSQAPRKGSKASQLTGKKKGKDPRRKRRGSLGMRRPPSVAA
ncbi:expressed unknown protein [Seminavis robusta]|uniref:Uncharacterized protein n=1 Tax=Seminavis robusta TaxID=568900 RepID=A0A9N8HVY4_9STRA|nr:expressed unknown protein [Seminavis robusta]|eukprot:Sro2091_g314000.1 n/a (706) ;mRNA; f:4486-6603